MMPTDEDRIDIRRQQIEELRDMIEWERKHIWGEAGGRELSEQIIESYEHVVALLEAVIVRLEASLVRH